jgi:hypothetical protein
MIFGPGFDSRHLHQMEKPCRNAVGPFYLHEESRGNRSEAGADSMSEERAGCPRKPAEGSLRRNGQEVRDVAGDSRHLHHLKNHRLNAMLFMDFRTESVVRELMTPAETNIW